MAETPVTKFEQFTGGALFDVNYCPWCKGKHRVRVVGREEHILCRRKKKCTFARFEVVEGIHHEGIGQSECQMKYQLKTPRLFVASALREGQEGKEPKSDSPSAALPIDQWGEPR